MHWQHRNPGFQRLLKVILDVFCHFLCIENGKNAYLNCVSSSHFLLCFLIDLHPLNWLAGRNRGVRWLPCPLSHPRVIGPTTALRRDPDDVLRGVLDVAGLAMHAVLRVDLQPVAAVGVLHEFVLTFLLC